MVDIVVEHLKELIHDQRHFSARWLRELKARSGAEPETVLMIGGGILGICLLQKDQAHFIANGILIAIPLILTYLFPKERPAIPLLLIYWAALASSTLFDAAFVEAVPIYYILKLGAMACFFLRPICGAQQIFDFLEKNKLIPSESGEPAEPEPNPFNAEELRELEKAKHKKSPPPEKPEGESKSARSLKSPRTTNTARTNSVLGVNNNYKSPLTPLITASPALPLPEQSPKSKSDDSSRQTRNVKSMYLPAPSEGTVVRESPAPTKSPKASSYLPVSPNPMLNDANYQLSSASNTSLASPAVSDASVEGDKNPDDLVFAPICKIIFNAPFDDRTLTYPMTVKNNSKKWIAYAIKSNAIPRVTAMPPSGILKPGDKHIVAVSIQKFNIDDINVSKDRIAFDYLFCPPETKAFTHSLLQGQATRRRKNIKIEYNV